MTPQRIRDVGEILGREGLAERAQEIMQEAINSGSYKKVIEAVGRLSVIHKACGYDVYWKEKASIGQGKEIIEMNHIYRTNQKVKS